MQGTEKQLTGLNPYSIGRYSVSTATIAAKAEIVGLNPYSIGRYSVSS